MRSMFLVALAALLGADSVRADIISFEDLVPGPSGYEDGANLAGSFVSGGASFNNSYDSKYGSWSGWSYSKVVDATTPGYLNQFAAFSPTGGDPAGGVYAVAYADAFSVQPPTIVLPAGQKPTSMRVANTTYAALSMRDGDPYGYSKKFGGITGDDPDFFLLTISGRDANGKSTGAINFYLADFRFDHDSILSGWADLDLSSLATGTTALSFALSSSDNGAFGMNTPAYFAVDNLQTASVPEPSSLLLFAAAVGNCWLSAVHFRLRSLKRKRTDDSQRLSVIGKSCRLYSSQDA